MENTSKKGIDNENNGRQEKTIYFQPFLNVFFVQRGSSRLVALYSYKICVLSAVIVFAHQITEYAEPHREGRGGDQWEEMRTKLYKVYNETNWEDPWINSFIHSLIWKFCVWAMYSSDCYCVENLWNIASVHKVKRYLRCQVEICCELSSCCTRNEIFWSISTFAWFSVSISGVRYCSRVHCSVGVNVQWNWKKRTTHIV